MTTASVSKAKPVPVKLKAVQATFEEKGHPLVGAVDGKPQTGWSVGGQQGKDQPPACRPRQGLLPLVPGLRALTPPG